MERRSPDPKNPTDEEQQSHRDVAKWTRAVAWFTFALVIVSAVSDFFIYQQYRVSNDAQRDTREQLRAVVTYGGLEISIVKATDNKIHYNVAATYRNTGGTRTNNFFTWISAHFFEGDVPNSQDFSKSWTPIKPIETIIGANSVGFSMVSVPEQDAINTRDGKGKLIVWGHAEWSDIFAKELIHVITYCEILEPVITDKNVTVVVSPQPFPGTDIVYLRASPFRPECNHSK